MTSPWPGRVPEQAMRIIDIAIIFISHGLALIPFVTSMLSDRRPATSDFAVLSFILYYDIGILMEVIGIPYTSDWFLPLLGARDSIFMLSVLFIALGPWLVHLGSWLTNREGRRLPAEPITAIAPERRRLFYWLLALIAVPLSLYGLLETLGGNPVWLTRLNVTSSWGPFIIILYFPLHFLAFYVIQRDSRTWKGTILCLALAVATVLSTIVIGQRTTILLPFLVLALFRFKMTVTRLAAALAILVVSAAILLSFFKFAYAQSDIGTPELLTETLSNDLARAPVLRTVLEQSEPWGTRIVPYPMSGYVYSALFFVPRSIVPFKGVSTAHYYTAYVAGTEPEETYWGLGIGMIEELMLNAGILLVVPGLIVYGLAMGILDRWQLRVPTLAVPSRLAALWLCGYNLPAILLTFGMMALVGMGLHYVFVRKGAILDLLRGSVPAISQPQVSGANPTQPSLGGTATRSIGPASHQGE